MKKTKIVIPASLHEKAIALGHEGHQGIVKSKAYLRQSVWVPNMNQRLTEEIGKCHPCQLVTVVPQKEPLKMVPLPDEPWTSVRADFYGPIRNEYILVVQDEYSRYPDVEIVSSTGHKAVGPALDKILSRFGILETLRSDNGPPFNGIEFAQFAKYMGFNHVPVPR